jgi:hypothetical protein
MAFNYHLAGVSPNLSLLRILQHVSQTFDQQVQTCGTLENPLNVLKTS